jgi:hypothetical protein
VTKLVDALSLEEQLDLVARLTSPARLAQTFAAFVGQFYDRPAFDAFARQASDCYDPARARTFRAHLDRRLADRYHEPVVWDLNEAAGEDAA